MKQLFAILSVIFSTFITAWLSAAEGPKLMPLDLARGKAASASSEERGNTAGKAIDGNLSTRWCANGPATGAWWQVDLGRATTVNCVRAEWESNGGHYRYKIETSADARTWQTAVDASKKDQPGPYDDHFAATQARYVRITFLGSSGGWGSIREVSVFGNETVAVDPQQAARQEEAALLSELKVPDGFEATIFAAPPAGQYPVFVSAAPNGDLYVSQDKNGSLGRKDHYGSVLRLRDTDGDGRADEVKRFVDDVDSPRGLAWDHDRLYLLHPPHLTAYIDRDGDGVAEESKRLVSNIAFDLKTRPADHTSNGVTLAMDGWLYLAIGDFGFMKAEGTDGRKVQLRGGGVVRVRPDGAGLEIYSRGTRNILIASFDPLLNGFSRDNTNDGGGWDIRLHHYSGLEHHGYPSLFKNFGDEIVQPLADYGGGSGCGGVYVDEPGFPAGYGNALYTADWGRGQIYRHLLTPHGATFTADQHECFTVPRATDIDVDANSRLYVSSWRNGGFSYTNDNVGFLARIVPRGYKPEPLPDFAKVDAAALVQLLRSPSAS
jgi:putative membrane-bound dehydrogenase-like protein